MAKVLTADQFKLCPKGTVFGYGERWNFSSLLILEEVIIGDGYWGFWANDPMWVESESDGEAIDRLDEMSVTGRSYPAATSLSKFMSYDGYSMEFFFVLEKADWDRITNEVRCQS